MTGRQSMNAAAIVVALVIPAAAAQEPPSPQMAGVAQAAVTGCAQAHPMAERTIEAANRRLEAARQANSPAAMRAAMDDLQAALRQLRTDIAPCAGLQSLAADPHAGHVPPGTAQAPAAAPGTPVVTPGSTAPQSRPATQMPARQPTGTGKTTIAFRTIPSQPRGAAENQFEVTLTDGQGKPIDGADVSLLFYMPPMPAMKMGEMRNELGLKGTGSGNYAAAGQIMMAGVWTVTVSVKQNGKEIGRQEVTISAK